LGCWGVEVVRLLVSLAVILLALLTVILFALLTVILFALLTIILPFGQLYCTYGATIFILIDIYLFLMEWQGDKILKSLPLEGKGDRVSGG
jgi:hypothetical protein